MESTTKREAPGGWDRLSRVFGYPSLLAFLVLTLLLGPLFHSAGGLVVPLLTLGILLGVVMVASQHPRTFRVAVLLAVFPAVGLAFRWSSPESELAIQLFFGTVVAFLTLAAVTILFDVLRAGRVGYQKLLGAVCVYLLLGTAWAWGFAWLHYVDPEALRFPPDVHPEASSWDYTKYEYFSFVTLTTLGYGDVSPATGAARVLAMLEAVVGQLFVAVVIARMVSLEVTHANRRDLPPSG